MSEKQVNASIRALVLIVSSHLEEKAGNIFSKAKVPVLFHLYAEGTAPNQLNDFLGLGCTEKRIFITILPRLNTESIMRTLWRELKLGTHNSGIAFTLPLNAANRHLVKVMDQIQEQQDGEAEKKEYKLEAEYALIAVIINSGYSEEVAEIARKAGAGGGTVLHSRQMVDPEISRHWGLSIQEDKEFVLILTSSADKAEIMNAISNAYGIRSAAQGLVISLPVDSLIGISKF